MTLRLRLLSAVLAVLMTAIPYIAFAQFPERIVPCDGAGVGGTEECTVCHIAELAQNVLNAAVYLAIFLSAMLFAWAGWKYVTAGGDTGKAKSAREIFTNVLIGIVIILVGWIVIDTVMKTLVRDDAGFGPWNSICSSGPGQGPGER